MRDRSDLESYPPPRSRESTEFVIQASGGAASYGAARMIVDEVGPDRVSLLFADTKIEDEDLYRFLDETSEDLGIPVTRLVDGRTPWQVFEDVRYIGNSRVDPCSMHLKRELLWQWLDDFCDPSFTTVVFGIDWTEEHRLDRIRKRLKDDERPWRVRAPLCEDPVTSKDQVLEWIEERGIEPPRLYDLGFPHNNCGGFCVKSGQRNFLQLLNVFPERYAEHEAQEIRMRKLLDKDISILRDRTIEGRATYLGWDPDRVVKYGKRHINGDTGATLPGAVPLTLREFREKKVAAGEVDEYDWGGCGCALD